jgi:voltage-gated potassium channel
MGALRLNERHNLFLIRIINKELDEALHFAIEEKEHSLNAGDVLVVMGPTREIRLFKKEVEACTN